MRALKIIGIVLLALVGIIFLATFFVTLSLPETYRVERSVTIQKPVAEVYDFVANHNNRPSWDPWIAKDPNCETKMGGTVGQPGHTWQWSGDEELIGKGKMETKEVEPNQSIHSHLTFISPMEAESEVYWNFEPVNGGTKVIWANEGSIAWPFNFVNLTMDSRLGPDFEQGLENLKGQLES